MIRFTSGSLFKVISLCKSGRRYSDEKIAEMLFPNVEYTTNYIGHVKDCTKNLPDEITQYMSDTDQEEIIDTLNRAVRKVFLTVISSEKQVKHEMTKQEAQELVKYNDDIKNHRWASKPQIRKYDKVYNGKLRIEFGERSYIRDNDSEKLEDRLGDILVTLYEKAEENRIVREAREESERKRVEEARCREENRQRKEQEIRLVKELVNKAEDYRIAKEIREYIQAMIDSGNEDITPEWIEWALKKADWYDPSIETEDEYLGKRQHEKSAEEKEKSLQDSIRKSWYW